MRYLSLQRHFPEIFNIIQRKLASPNDPVPNYTEEKDGIDKLSGILERVKMPYYGGFCRKASYLFLGLILGHYFSNGNKRLAITSLIYFYDLNKYSLMGIERKLHKQKLRQLFPSIVFDRRIKGAEVFDNMLYDISIFIAKGGHDFRNVCNRFEEYLQFCLKK